MTSATFSFVSQSAALANAIVKGGIVPSFGSGKLSSCLNLLVSSSTFAGKRGNGSLKSSLHNQKLHNLPDTINLERGVIARPYYLTRAAATGIGSVESKMTKVVEHVVYFKFKPETPPETVNAIVSALRGLEFFEGILQLNVGESVKIPGVDNGGWTHVLHGRHVSKEALENYSRSEEHVKVVKELVLPNIADVLAVDWEVELEEPIVDSGIGVIHTAAMKLKEGTEKPAIEAMVKGLKGHEGVIPGLRQVSVGPNFSPARSQGHDWGFLSTYGTVEDLKTYAMHPDHGAVMKELVFPLVEKSASVDFYTNVPAKSKM